MKSYTCDISNNREEEMPEPTEVKLSDFHEQSTWDAFYLAATPKFFEWLRWAATLAALKYVQQKAHSSALGILIGVAGGLLLLYFCAYFHQFRFTDLPFARSPAAKRATSILLSGFLGGATWWLVDYAVDAILLIQR